MRKTVLFQKLLMESDCMGYIYKITNILNQKSYIGKTIRDPEIRWNEHKQDNKHPNLPLQRAFKKYGIDSFSFEIIEEVKEELLDEREKYYIKKFNTYKQGYNATLGGEGGVTHTLPKEEIEKILTLWKQKCTISQISKITGHSFSAIQNHIKKTGITNEQYKKQIKLNKNKALKNIKLCKRQNLKKENKFTKEQEKIIFEDFNNFYSCTYISKKIKCSYKKLYNFLKNFYTEEEIIARSKIKTSLSKKYYKYTLDDIFIKEYKNREELKQDYTESQIKVIQNCARGAKKNAYGYKWSYFPY